MTFRCSDDVQRALRTQGQAAETGAVPVGGASDTAARVAEAVRAAMDALPAQQQVAGIDVDTAQPPPEPVPGSSAPDAAAGEARGAVPSDLMQIPAWKALQRRSR